MTSLRIEQLKNKAADWWLTSRPGFSPSQFHYSRETRSRKEREVRALMETIESSRSENTWGPHYCNGRRDRTTSRIRGAMTELLHCFDCPIDASLEHRFTEVMEEFTRLARDFDEHLGGESIYQAARNVLIMNTFQMYFDAPLSLTPSIFAYSLLYPYTDNYLDDPEISKEDKDTFIGRLGCRLAGTKIEARTAHEEPVFRLVKMIESEFDRSRYPQVFESLLGIHSAQVRSLRQHGNPAQMANETLLDISVEKGGTSVLADGCLVAGTISSEDAEFFFGFGVLLQLIDDLQDLEEDASHGHHTLFTSEAEVNYLDDLTNQLFASVSSTLYRSPDGETSRRNAALRLIERGCRLLILEAVACNESRYRSSFLRATETTSPVGFEFLRSMKTRLHKEYSRNEEVSVELEAV
ncbi:MAG TPA: hypothetical protein VLY03_05440 [Bacteroidota bacterium]|nr:hypothetical protein [Bacteroidota bacterium]